VILTQAKDAVKAVGRLLGAERANIAVTPAFDPRQTPS